MTVATVQETPGSSASGQSAVDWLTATWPGGEVSKEAWDVGNILVAQEEASGEELRPWTLHGFKGWSAGGAAVAARGEETMVRLSGEAAAREALTCLRIGGRPSRLDVQTTVTFALPASSIFGCIWREVQTAAKGKGRPPRHALTVMRPAGTLLTIGSRSSVAYGRAYDKGVEAKLAEPFKIIRFEAETKQHLARAIGARLAADPEPEALCSAYVYSLFSRWGVRSWPLSSDGDRSPASRQAIWSPRTHTDLQRLRWLQTAVAPMLRKLSARVGEEAISRALQWPPGLYSSPDV
jgi:hypothetical protein